MANQTVAKTAAVKTEEKKAAVKAEETKAAVKAEEKKAAPAAVKEEKPVTKETPKKEAAKKVYVQYQDAEIEPKKVLEQVKTDWVKAGHRVSSIKKVDLYIKPEEGKAYWVINGKETGSVDL